MKVLEIEKTSQIPILVSNSISIMANKDHGEDVKPRMFLYKFIMSKKFTIDQLPTSVVAPGKVTIMSHEAGEHLMEC